MTAKLGRGLGEPQAADGGGQGKQVVVPGGRESSGSVRLLRATLAPGCPCAPTDHGFNCDERAFVPALTPAAVSALLMRLFQASRRAMVAEGTFRPPWYHRNVMSEFMGLVRGTYDAKAEGFVTGGASLHNMWSSHGPDAQTYRTASSQDLAPQKIEDTLAFMFETRWPVTVTDFAHAAAHRQQDYDSAWAGIERGFPRSQPRPPVRR